MGSKTPSSTQYYIAAALALAIGIYFTFVTLHYVLGPGMLAIGILFVFMGSNQQSAEKANQAPSPAPTTNPDEE